MNIICNDCAGAYLYKDCMKSDFMNPFIWSSIDIDNFVRLIQNYDYIDFNNIKCNLIQNDSGICKQGSTISMITIDNCVDVFYFHYILNEKYNDPTKTDGYTMYKDIKKYTIECYLKRLEKMTSTPIFIWDVTRILWYNKKGIDPVSAFNNINSKYNIIIYSPSVSDDTKANIITLNKTNSCFEVNVSANNIYKKYLNKYGG